MSITLPRRRPMVAPTVVEAVAVETAPKPRKRPMVAPAPASPQRTEVQGHGFTWEDELIRNVYLATDEERAAAKITYTSKMDLPSALNHLDGCDLSIKATGGNAVCMADCLRVFDAVSSGIPFHMVVIRYKQNDDTKTKKIVSITEVDLTSSTDLLFGGVTREQIEELDAAVKAVPQKRSPTKEEYTHMYAIRDSLQKDCGAIHLDIKCNSQQSRLQCSFNKFNLFVENNPSRVVSRSSTNEFRGGAISLEISSGRRAF